jgi:hypothetical protein
VKKSEAIYQREPDREKNRLNISPTLTFYILLKKLTPMPFSFPAYFL